MPLCFSFSFFQPLLSWLFLSFTSTQYSCLRTTKGTAQSTQEAVWQGTRGSFSNIFFSVSSFSLHLDFGRGWRRRRGERREEEEEEGGGKGVNQHPTSISNSLCSPHASRGSDLTLARRKKQILYNVSQRDGASGLMSRLGCKHPACAVEESRRRCRGVKLLFPPEEYRESALKLSFVTFLCYLFGYYKCRTVHIK